MFRGFLYGCIYFAISKRVFWGFYLKGRRDENNNRSYSGFCFKMLVPFNVAITRSSVTELLWSDQIYIGTRVSSTSSDLHKQDYYRLCCHIVSVTDS